MFALVWSIGCNTTDAGRALFEKFFRALANGEVPPELEPFMNAPAQKLPIMPEAQSVYSYVYDIGKAKWVPWLETVDVKPPDGDAEYSSIIVQTVDTVRYSFLLDKLVRHKRPCLFVGPTGTGKSVYVKRHLAEGLPVRCVHMLMTFSAQTSANMS